MATKDIGDKQVCLAYKEFERQTLLIKTYEWPYEILMRITGQPFKVCYRAMERACKRGFIDYGVSLRSGWLTSAGKALTDESK